MGANGYRVLAAFLVLLGIGSVLFANYTMLASKAGGMTRKDFMSLWSDGKALALGLNPYDEAVWRPLRANHGDTWLPDAICPFPAWTILFFVPLSLLPTQMAGALWMTISEIALIGGVFMLVRALNWHSSPRYWVWGLVGVMLFRPLFSAIANGQLVPVLFFLLALAFYTYQKGYYAVAGMLLALQITKPSLTLFLVPLLGLILLVRRDWRTLGGFVGGGLGLLAVSWIVLPGWLFQWLGTAKKAEIAGITPTAWGLAYDLIGDRYQTLVAIVSIALLCLVITAVIWRPRRDNLLFSLGIALGLSVFATPYLWAYEQLILLFPALVGLYWGTTSNGAKRQLWVGGWLLVTFGLSWTLPWVAMLRGVDTWSALVTLGVTGYFVVAWKAYNREQFEAEETYP